MPPQGPSPALFFDTIAPSAYRSSPGGHRTRFVLHVAAGRQTPTELANACQAAPRGVRILADYLTIIGFLPKHGDRYELTADSKVFLDRKSPAYLGGAVSFMLAPGMRESFHQLTAAVQRGGTAISDEGTVSHDNPIWVEFARAMAPLMQMPAQLLAGLVGGIPGNRSACSMSPRATACSALRSRSTIARRTSPRSIGRMCWRSQRKMRGGQMSPSDMRCVRVVPLTLIGAARTTSCS